MNNTSRKTSKKHSKNSKSRSKTSNKKTRSKTRSKTSSKKTRSKTSSNTSSKKTKKTKGNSKGDNKVGSKVYNPDSYFGRYKQTEKLKRMLAPDEYNKLKRCSQKHCKKEFDGHFEKMEKVYPEFKQELAKASETGHEQTLKKHELTNEKFMELMKQNPQDPFVKGVSKESFKNTLKLRKKIIKKYNNKTGRSKLVKCQKKHCKSEQQSHKKVSESKINVLKKHVSELIKSKSKSKSN